MPSGSRQARVFRYRWRTGPYPALWSGWLRTRKRRIGASDRVLLIGTKSVLATPGDEK